MVTRRVKWLSGRSVLAMCLMFSLSAYAEEGNDNEDLDKYSDQDLNDDLDAELDDVLAGELPKTRAGLISAFENALHDEGDADDPKERAISWKELVNEMSEAGTSVHEVVAKAVPDPPTEPESPGSHENSENRGDSSLPDLGPQPDALSFKDFVEGVKTSVRDGLRLAIRTFTSDK